MNLYKFIITLLIITSCGEKSAEKPSKSKENQSEKSVNSIKDPLFKYSWHLENNGEDVFSLYAGLKGVDIKASEAWELGITGKGVEVAVSDGRIDLSHEDLTKNSLMAKSRDYNSDYPFNGNPTHSENNSHGTLVSGIIGAASNNRGSLGVAYNAKVAGLNFLSSDQAASKYYDQASVDVDIFNYSYGFDGCIAAEVDPAYLNYVRSGILNLRDGKGSIYITASGNDFDGSYEYGVCNQFLLLSEISNNLAEYWYSVGYSGNSNFDQINSYPYYISVGSINSFGFKATYSTPGSNLWVSAPGGEDGYDFDTPDFFPSSPGILGPDLEGCNVGYAWTGSELNDFERNFNKQNDNCNYTSGGVGTSFAAPVVSGVAALILEANPNLTWRDVKYILAYSARQFWYSPGQILRHPKGSSYDLSGHVYDYGWIVNSKGFKFHNHFGFGSVNAKAAVQFAKNYKLNLGEFQERTIDSGSINYSIPDNSSSGKTVTISNSTYDLNLEGVQLEITLNHNFYSDLGIEIESPSGTKSKVMWINSYNLIGGAFDGVSQRTLTFLSNAFFMENAIGDWKVKVVDGESGGAGYVNRVKLNFFGHDSSLSLTNRRNYSAPKLPNSISLYGSSSDFSENTLNKFLVTDVRSGETVYLYSDSSCNNEIGSVLAESSEASIITDIPMGNYTIYAKVKNQANVFSSCSSSVGLSFNLTVDEILSAPSGLTLVNPLSNSSYISTPTIRVSGVSSGNVVEIHSNSTCSNLVGSGVANSNYINIELNPLSEGSYRFYARRKKSSSSSNDSFTQCSSSSVTYTYDFPDEPLNLSFQINSGLEYTSNQTVSLSINTLNASEMYVTNTAGCTNGGSWENYTETKEWTLGELNTTANVYVKFRSQNGAESDCIGDSIIHDSIPPSIVIFSINGNDDYTNSTSVTLSSNVVDAVSMFVSNSSGCTEGSWASYQASRSWNLGQSNSLTNVYVKYKDHVGNETSCVSDSITHDSIAPAIGSLSINSGSSYTNSLSANLTISASDADEMYVTNNSTCSSGGSWESYGTSKTWSLGQSNSTASVYVKFRDFAGNESSCYSDSIVHDNIAPESPTIVINNGNSYTNSTNVTLNLSAIGASELFVSNSSNCSTGSWQSYTTSRSWTLSGENSTRRVYVKFKDLSGNETSCINDSIAHDSIAPELSSITINNDADYTNSSSVTISSSATGANYIYLTNNSSCSSGGSWQSYANSKSWTLGQLNTTATVYAKVKDNAGNESSCLSDTIIHDNIAPSDYEISIVEDRGYITTSYLDIRVVSSEVDQVYITENDSCSSGGTWQAYSEVLRWNLIEQYFYPVLYIKLSDMSGNTTDCIELKSKYYPTKDFISIPQNLQSFSALISNRVNDFKVKNGVIYIATDGGLAISWDGGQHFLTRNLANGLRSNKINKIFISNNNIYLATSNGLSYSTDNGATFFTYTTENGLGSNLVNDVFVFNDKVYAATADGLSIGSAQNGTFVNKDDFYNHNFTAVYVSPEGTVYAASKATVHFSSNDFATSSSSGTIDIGTSISSFFPAEGKLYVSYLYGYKVIQLSTNSVIQSSSDKISSLLSYNNKTYHIVENNVLIDNQIAYSALDDFLFMDIDVANDLIYVLKRGHVLTTSSDFETVALSSFESYRDLGFGYTDFDMKTNDNIYFISGNDLYFSDDRGKNIELLLSKDDVNGNITNVQVDQNDSSRVFISVHYTCCSQYKVFESTDNFLSLNEIYSTTNMITDLHYSPNTSELFIIGATTFFSFTVAYNIETSTIRGNLPLATKMFDFGLDTFYTRWFEGEFMGYKLFSHNDNALVASVSWGTHNPVIYDMYVDSDLIFVASTYYGLQIISKNSDGDYYIQRTFMDSFYIENNSNVYGDYFPDKNFTKVFKSSFDYKYYFYINDYLVVKQGLMSDYDIYDLDDGFIAPNTCHYGKCLKILEDSSGQMYFVSPAGIFIRK